MPAWEGYAGFVGIDLKRVGVGNPAIHTQGIHPEFVFRGPFDGIEPDGGEHEVRV